MRTSRVALILALAALGYPGIASAMDIEQVRIGLFVLSSDEGSDAAAPKARDFMSGIVKGTSGISSRDIQSNGLLGGPNSFIRRSMTGFSLPSKDGEPDGILGGTNSSIRKSMIALPSKDGENIVYVSPESLMTPPGLSARGNVGF